MIDLNSDEGYWRAEAAATIPAVTTRRDREPTSVLSFLRIVAAVNLLLLISAWLFSDECW
jgi:hypothetical protein